MFYFAFEYHLQYELSKSPLFVIFPNLREKMQSLLIHVHVHVFTVELCQVYNLQLMIELGTK